MEAKGKNPGKSFLELPGIRPAAKKDIYEEDESDQNKISEGRKCLLILLEGFLLGSEGISFAFDAMLYSHGHLLTYVYLISTLCIRGVI